MEKVKHLAAGVLVLLVLSLVGAAPPASAKICSKAGTGAGCAGSHGSVYGGVPPGALSAKLAAGKTFTLTSGFIQVTCAESSLAGELIGESGKGFISGLTLGACHSNADTSANSCSVEASASTAAPWTLQATPGTAPNGTMAIEGLTTTFTCKVFGSNTTCRYKAAKTEASVTGGETATLALSGASVAKEEVSSGFCSATASLDATFSVTTPDSLYLTTVNGSSAICSKAGTGAGCAGSHGSVYGGVPTGVLSAKLAAGKTFTLTSGFIQ